MRTSSVARQFVACAPLAAVLIVLLPAVSAAQEPVKSFDQLNTRLKVGDTVWVTDAQGREIKGRITSFSPDALAVDADGGKSLPADQVRVIQNRSHDSLKNGALIGFLAGLGAGAALAAWLCSECNAGGAVAGVFLYGGIGAGIGTGIDAAFRGPRQVVYRAPGASGSARLSLGPVITPRAKALALTYSF